MSPEQASGDTATAKSDLYSLGATLYQLATGTLPYAGSPAKVMAQIASGALVAPVKRTPAVGPELSRVIERDDGRPSRRPRTASAAAVAAELRALATAGGLGDPADELAAYFADPEAFVRERTPRVVRTAGRPRAEHALAEAKLPRAMALADRASALAPEDPTVAALIDRVAAGGRATQRRKIVGLAALGLALAGGGIGLAVTLLGGQPASPPPDAATVALADVAPDAAVVAVLPADAGGGEPPDTVVAVAVDAGVIDAPGPRVRVDASVRRDAGGEVVTLTADASVLPVDAAVVAVVVDAAPAPGAILVKNDTWCNIEIDGVARGRNADRPFPVDPGPRTVTCTQGIGSNRSWTERVTVAPGATTTVRGSLLGTFDVTIATAGEAIVDGVAYRPGAVVRLKRGSVHVTSGGVGKHLPLTGTCELRDKPLLDCYR